jgi:hypothetical protein
MQKEVNGVGVIGMHTDRTSEALLGMWTSPPDALENGLEGVVKLLVFP